MLYHEAWKKLCECEGVLVPGGFGKRGVEGKIAASQWARHVVLKWSKCCAQSIVVPSFVELLTSMHFLLDS